MTIKLRELFEQHPDSNAEMQGTLLKAIKSNHKGDFDYITFKQSIAKMKEMGLDEETCIKSAFATASTMGMSKEKLLNSVKSYLRVLNKEKDSFALSLKNQIATKIDGELVQVEKLKKQIVLHQKKIESLQKEIELYQSKIDNVDTVVASNKEKIEYTRDKFRFTYDDLSRQIEEDLLSIDKYL